MNETQKLYRSIYKNAQMGMGSTATILSAYTTGGLCEEITQHNREYRNILVEAKNALGNKCAGCCLTEKEKMKTACMIKMKLMKDDSDSAIAEMLIQGCTMGVIDTIKAKKSFANAEGAAIALADRLINFQTGTIEKMKEFL